MSVLRFDKVKGLFFYWYVWDGWKINLFWDGESIKIYMVLPRLTIVFSQLAIGDLPGV